MENPVPKQKRTSFSMSKLLITLGVVLLLAGFFWPYLQKLNLFHLPGDIVVEKKNFQFYFPITTSIILSIVLTLIIWLISRFR